MAARCDFVVDIPDAMPEAPMNDEPAGPPREKTGDRFPVLWSDGYNTWTDVDTLFKGLSTAMESDQRIAFVSTGGATEGHDERTCPKFLSMIKRSPHRYPW